MNETQLPFELRCRSYIFYTELNLQIQSGTQTSFTPRKLKMERKKLNVPSSSKCVLRPTGLTRNE